MTPREQAIALADALIALAVEQPPGKAKYLCNKGADLLRQWPEQPTRKPLTEDALFDLLKSVDEAARRLPLVVRDFARAIEAAHGIGGDV